MLRLEGVIKSYGGRRVIDELDLDVASGETVALIGPSGCGKSTALRLLLGLAVPEAGKVHFDGVTVSRETVSDVRRRVGYVIQDGGLFPHMTARENVMLKARTLGWDTARLDARLGVLRELTNFPIDGLDRYPVELSGGQRQRVALMRGLMLDPDVLLLDEPLGALDPMIRFNLQEDLRGIFRTLEKTVVLVTHDLSEAVFFGDRIVLMRDGKVVQHGTLDALARSPADPFVTEFINAQRGHSLPETSR
ncbi:MAG: ATP-binding cassette domain-containing protein [Gemmatimonadetes bacterium]|nr:ATP-binding cassette domain-containing protein [Gemmatimonadota bacterium]